jgi:positive regulator of sigma E activity
MNYHIVTETAIVVAEEPPNSGRFLVEMLSHEADLERCATCRMCGDRAGKKVMTAVLGKDIAKSEVVPGAEVVVEIKIPVIYTHILFVFVLPIIGFLAGAGLGFWLVGAEGVKSLITVGLGFIGAVLLFLAGKPLFGEKVTRREDPVIVGIVDRPQQK